MSMPKSPLISVVMSVYNEEKYIKDTIESILNQTFEDFEFIIINDGSTDKTQEILEYYRQKDKRIEIVINKKNIGLTRSLNKGIEHAVGKYIARMDSGDISHPARFEKQIKFLEENKDIWMVGTWTYWIDENKTIIGKLGRFTSPKDIKDNLFITSGASIHPSLMIKKELFDKIGLYDIKATYGQDYELYFRTIKNGFNIANIPECLIYIMKREGISFKKKGFVISVKVQAKYLPYFLNIKNVIYFIWKVFRCLLILVMPNFLLKKLTDKRVRRYMIEKHRSNKRY